ncbi:efflux RND transporter periplasmic adaptor subunit [Aliifodinibius salicampi]|uniref:Efflux RND transporter periplasmic adaptor subunit n=1 Tax=Fodinibius salicampi TaxID=1920655 RepID=A0ABT3PWZ1_9BACT|nr:efflux RND transporter periplasmic adaptor subunit [Fodinibius salicampi]MCW9712377.1 efflux RND transporter periplasmic adaptor subunit [Fodinibius salicampi]
MAKKQKSSTQKLFVFSGVIILLLALGGITAKYMGWLGGGDKGKTVETVKAELKTITQVVSASGKIQPEVEVTMRPEVSGEIIELPIKEGDYVSKGDLLLRIKPDIYQARIDEINASLLTQKARLEEARANLLEAESVFNQNKELYESQAISKAEYIQSKSSYEARQASFQAAEYQVQSIQAQLQQAREELQKTIIRAPREGTISKLAVEVGERVLGNTQSIGTELLRIAKMDQMEVQIEVNENDIVNVAVNDSANIMVDAYPDRVFGGVVTEIANSADVTSEGTSEEVTNYEVKIRVSTAHNLDMAGDKLVQSVSEGESPEDTFTPSFKPGMSATVDVKTQTAHNVVSVPIQAVTVRDFADESVQDTTENDSLSNEEESVIPVEDMRKVVFVVEDGRGYRREVKTGISDNTHMQILSGLEEGEEVVTGSYRILSNELADGDKVNINNRKFSSR